LIGPDTAIDQLSRSPRGGTHLAWGRSNQFAKRRKPPVKAKQKPARSRTAAKKRYDGFTAAEKGAMQDRVQEMKAAAAQADGESSVLAKIAEMKEPDRVQAERLHAVIKAGAPSLTPRLWYGMPAYAKDGKVLCFFQSAQKFKTRYATFGFSDVANLDEGTMWPVSFALTKLTAADEARIGALLKKALS
jgi:uncharacterized protein YdhG (YjbR/CyaY superfamily)